MSTTSNLEDNLQFYNYKRKAGGTIAALFFENMNGFCATKLVSLIVKDEDSIRKRHAAVRQVHKILMS